MSTMHAMTMSEKAKASRLALVWQIDADHVLEIGAVSRTDDGQIRYSYRLTRNRQPIFDGIDHCSDVGSQPLAETLVHAAPGLLGFLTLRPGYVEADYFDDYTREQRSWRDEFAKELSAYAQDRCCGYCGGDHNSLACVDR